MNFHNYVAFNILLLIKILLYYHHTFILIGEKVMSISKPISEKKVSEQVKKVFEEINLSRDINLVLIFGELL